MGILIHKKEPSLIQGDKGGKRRKGRERRRGGRGKEGKRCADP